MPYDVFRPEGPTIPISLYPDAFSKGVAAGNALPTPLTSAIQGGIQGVKEGVALAGQITNIQSEQQQQVLRQHQIERLDELDKMHDEQLKQLELKNRLDTLTVENAETNRTLILQDQTATLEADVAEKKNKLAYNKRLSEYNAELQKSDATGQRDIILGGKYNDLYQQNPKILKSSYESLLTNPTVDAATRDKIKTAIGRSNALDAAAKEALKREGKYNDARSKFQDSPLTRELSHYFPNTPPEEFIKDIELVPQNKFLKDKSGQNYLLGDDGQRILNPKFDDKVDSHYFEVATGNRVLTNNVHKDLRKDYDTFQQERRYQDGSYAKGAVDSVPQAGTPDSLAASKTAQGAGAPDTQATAAPVSSLEGSAEAVAQTFKIAPKYSSELVRPLGTLKGYVNKYVTEPTTRKNTGLELQKFTTDFARSLAYYQFESSPEVQNRYDQTNVDAYNATLNLGGARGEVLEPFKVSSPKELFYQINRTTIETQLQDMTSNLIKAQEYRKEVPGRKKLATQSIIQRLNRGKLGAAR